MAATVFSVSLLNIYSFPKKVGDTILAASALSFCGGIRARAVAASGRQRALLFPGRGSPLLPRGAGAGAGALCCVRVWTRAEPLGVSLGPSPPALVAPPPARRPRARERAAPSIDPPRPRGGAGGVGWGGGGAGDGDWEARKPASPCAGGRCGSSAPARKTEPPTEPPRERPL